MILGHRPADGRLRRLVFAATTAPEPEPEPEPEPVPTGPPNLLLDPSFEDLTTGQWRARTRSTIEKVTERFRHGARSLKVVSTGAGIFDVDTNNVLTAVAPSGVYTFLASIYPTTSRQFLVAVEWLRADRTLINASGFQSPTMTAGVWNEFVRTYPAAPADAAYARFILRSQDGVLGETFYVDQVSFRAGTDTTWSST